MGDWVTALLLVGAAISTSGVVFGFYMRHRNDCVFKFRNAILDKCEADRSQMMVYRKLPSYETMVRRFWIWPLEKFLPKDEP